MPKRTNKGPSDAEVRRMAPLLIAGAAREMRNLCDELIRLAKKLDKVTPKGGKRYPRP
jgi:hypothetical protein